MVVMGINGRALAVRTRVIKVGHIGQRMYYHGIRNWITTAQARYGVYNIVTIVVGMVVVGVGAVELAPPPVAVVYHVTLCLVR